MAIVRIIQPPITREMYDAVNAALLRAGDTPPDGLIMHSAGEADGKWQIVDVWESEEQAQRFDSERLIPAIAAASGEESPATRPPLTVYELHNLILP